jgi:hypothetical protein
MDGVRHGVDSHRSNPLATRQTNESSCNLRLEGAYVPSIVVLHISHSTDLHLHHLLQCRDREYSVDQRGGRRFNSPQRGRSPMRQRSHSPFRSSSASELRPNTRGNQSAEVSVLLLCCHVMHDPVG